MPSAGACSLDPRGDTYGEGLTIKSTKGFLKSQISDYGINESVPLIAEVHVYL